MKTCKEMGSTHAKRTTCGQKRYHSLCSVFLTQFALWSIESIVRETLLGEFTLPDDAVDRRKLGVKQMTIQK